MATILSLALKVNADASGVVKNLTPAERALEKLAGQASKATSVFDEFASTSAAAANAQFNASKSMADLADSLSRGEISAQEFASRYADLTDEINKEAAAFKRAAQITADNISPAEKYSRTVAELDDQVRMGRISQETYNRALEKAKGDLDKTSTAVAKTDKSMESLARNTSILAGIEIGRLFLDGLSAIGNVFQDIGSRVTSLVSSVNSSVDTLNDFSARTGIGVEALQGYSLAAKLAGVDTEQFGAAVQKLAVNIGKATPGDALDKSLRAINLSVQELRALAPEDQFSAIGNAISQLPTAADRAAAAVEIFGKQGAALAPLFREGAASLEELKAKAERLGIIVSETQVNNVADMNDAFDLVRATIEGIVGQVIGNLAPAVTDVTNQFLQFVESWSGAQGEGGTGIANAITDVLLRGAEYFAGIFDEFVANFGSLGETFSYAADIFDVVSKVLLTASEGLRAAFNAIQIGIDVLLMGFGKIIESLGSYISSDLEQFGAGLAAASKESADRNSREMEAAAANAANTFNSIFTGGNGNAEQAGQGAASQYLSGLRSEIEQARRPEVKVELNLGNTEERLQQFLATAGDEASVFLQQSMATVDTFQEMAAAGGLTADQIEIMNGFMENVNAELDKELAKRQEAADAAMAQAEADKKRLDQLMETKDEGARIESDLLTVQREQARVSEQLAAARASNNQADADAAAARQAELDQLQASLEEQQRALEQGFGQGFQAAFDQTDQSIMALRDDAVALGVDASAAWIDFSFDVAELQRQVKDGLITKEAYDAELKRRRELYDQEIADIERTGEQRKKVNEYVDQQLALQQFGGDQERLAASQRVLEIEQEIVRVQEELKKAREAGNKEEADAAARRLGELDQVKAKEEDIASGRGKYEEDIRKQQETALQAYQQQQQQAQQAYAQEQARIFEEQRKAAEAEAKRQEERIRKLNTLGAQSISVADIRNAESANLVLQLGANAQDPQLIQQRLQTKLLEKIALGIGQASSNYFNQPVAIVGYADVGGI